MPIRRIGLVTRTYRHVNRYRQILTVLARYGFGELIDSLRIAQYVEIGLQYITRGRREHIEALTRAQRARMVLEELGPTFIKLGQLLSTRPDLIPVEFVREFERLQERVPPFAFEQVREIVEAELRAPLSEVFERFEEAPLAAASIGQVHRAVLRDGEDVVVKVQRPRIRRTIEVDLEILLHLATLVERHVEGGAALRPTRIVDEFARVIEQELDYRIEAAHLERFARQFEGDETVYVPKVFREATTARVLTMEFVEGVRCGDAETLRRAGLDPKRVAMRGAELILKQIFVHGFFHADPHPGNLFILPGEVICYLDFGMVGRLTRRARETFADFVYAVAGRDPARVTGSLLRLTDRDPGVEPDVEALERDVAQMLDLHLVAHLKELDLGKLLQQLIDLIRRHGLRISPDLVMMLKAMVTAEGLGRQLDPEIDMVAIAEPYVRRVKMERLLPGRLARDLYDSGTQMLELAREIPFVLRDILYMAKRGQFHMGFEHRGLERLQETLDRVSNRVAFAIVVAALIVGSSLIVQSRIPPLWYGIPVVGLVGFLTAGVMGFWLLASILRHGRM